MSDTAQPQESAQEPQCVSVWRAYPHPSPQVCCVIAYIDDLAARFSASEAALKQAQADGWCDCCCGKGDPGSGRPCICGGTGRASDAVNGFRKLLAQAEAERDRAVEDSKRLDWLDDHATELWTEFGQIDLDQRVPGGEDLITLREALDAARSTEGGKPE